MNTSKNVNKLVKISMLTAMAFVLMLFEFPIPGFPPFLKLDFSDLPALIGGLALGPVAGVIVEGGKIVLNLAFNGTYTAGIGELANFLVGGVFVFVASFIYHINKAKKSAILGLIAGTLAMTIVGALFNYYILLPFYATVMGGMSNVVGSAAEGNSNISSVLGVVVLGITPFNILKGAIVSIITFISYKRLSPLLNKENVMVDQSMKRRA